MGTDLASPRRDPYLAGLPDGIGPTYGPMVRSGAKSRGLRRRRGRRRRRRRRLRKEYSCTSGLAQPYAQVTSWEQVLVAAKGDMS
jgi:hypothetical protein